MANAVGLVIPVATKVSVKPLGKLAAEAAGSGQLVGNPKFRLANRPAIKMVKTIVTRKTGDDRMRLRKVAGCSVVVFVAEEKNLRAITFSKNAAGVYAK